MSEAAAFGRRMLLREAGLNELCRASEGSALVRIALLDGPIHRAHPLLAQARIEEHPFADVDGRADERHATSIASILVGRAPDAVGVAPGCTLVSIPVQDARFQARRLSAREAAARIASAIDCALTLDAHIVQLSLEFLPEADAAFGPVAAAVARAAHRGVCTVVAAGNTPRLGASRLLAAPGVLPVCVAGGRLSPAAGAGVTCPGSDIPVALPPDRVGRVSGSSFATALASGAVALLKSLYPHLSALAIAACRPRSPLRSLVPPMLDARAWRAALHPLSKGVSP